MADHRPPPDPRDAAPNGEAPAGASPAAAPPKKRRIDWSIVFFVALCLASGVASWWIYGPGAVASEARDAAWTVAGVVPQLTLGILVAAFAQVVVPRDKVGRLLGEQSGLKGLTLATVFGIVMPGGPFASFPLVYALARSGADMGALIAFLVAWATVSLSRLLIWEIPFMGLDFGVLRFVSSLPLPLLAGLFARIICRAWPTLRLKPDPEG
jgi:hypothetical protein